jgi:hypothetical protein
LLAALRIRPGEKQEEGKRREKVVVVDVRSLRGGAKKTEAEEDNGGRGRMEKAAPVKRADGLIKMSLDPEGLAKVMLKVEEKEARALYLAEAEDDWRREVRGMGPREAEVEAEGDY